MGHLREMRKDNVEIEGAGEPTRARMAPNAVWAGDCTAQGQLEKCHQGSYGVRGTPRSWHSPT